MGMGPIGEYLQQQKQKADAEAVQKQLTSDMSHGRILSSPPAGGPMSFSPMYGQPMRGTTQYLGPPSPQRKYTPNPFMNSQQPRPMSFSPPPQLQQGQNPGMVGSAGAQPPPTAGPPPTRFGVPEQQALIQGLRTAT